MPQLPSGQHVALKINFDRDNLLQDAYSGIGVHKLMAITKRVHLWPYIDVMYFKKPEKEIDEEVKYFHTLTSKPPENLTPYFSGHTLMTIGEEFKNWSIDDIYAFIGLVFSPGAETYFDWVLEEVEKIKKQILEEGSFLGRLYAHMWNANCHPLQIEDEEAGGAEECPQWSLGSEEVEKAVEHDRPSRRLELVKGTSQGKDAWGYRW